MKPTIKDVAKKAGVSMMTVSRVINNKGFTSVETRKKILEAIEEIDYKPNILARSLVTKESRFITIVIPDISNPFFAEMVKEAEDIARKNKYIILLGDTEGRKEIEKEYSEAAINRMSDGIILIAPRMEDKLIIKINDRVPLVLVDRPIAGKDIAQINSDDFSGAVLAVEHLIGLNHKRIGFLSGTRDIPAGLQREEGYIKTLKKNNIDIQSKLIVEGDWTFKSGRDALDRFISNDQASTAIFASNDLMALGLIQRAQEMNIKIPEDLSIIGFDDISMAVLVNPSLTTVRQPRLEMGKVAIELLINKLQKKSDIKNNILLKNKLIIRNSTGEIA